MRNPFRAIHNAERLDVDARYLLANERTLLAWIRTSIAIEAGGVALLQLHQHNRTLGILTLLSGATVALIGYHRFHAADQAIRAHKLPPAGVGPAIQVGMVVIIAIVLAITELTVFN